MLYHVDTFDELEAANDAARMSDPTKARIPWLAISISLVFWACVLLIVSLIWWLRK